MNASIEKESEMAERQEHDGFEQSISNHAVTACIAVTAVAGLSLTALVTTLPSTIANALFFDWYGDRSHDFIQVFRHSGISTAVAFTSAILLRFERVRQFFIGSGLLIAGIAVTSAVIAFLQLLDAFSKGSNLLISVLKAIA